jgi:hypothetical protein
MKVMGLYRLRHLNPLSFKGSSDQALVASEPAWSSRDRSETSRASIVYPVSDSRPDPTWFSRARTLKGGILSRPCLSPLRCFSGIITSSSVASGTRTLARHQPTRLRPAPNTPMKSERLGAGIAQPDNPRISYRVHTLDSTGVSNSISATDPRISVPDLSLGLRSLAPQIPVSSI